MKKKIAAVILSVLMLMSFTACGNDSKKAKSNKSAMGRYVETPIEVPENISSVGFFANKDGSVELYGLLRESENQASPKLKHFTSKDKKTWEELPLTWDEDIKNSQTGLMGISKIERDQSGSLYAIGADKDQLPRCYKVENNKAVELPMPSWDKMPEGMIGGADGETELTVAISGESQSDENEMPAYNPRMGIAVNEMLAYENDIIMSFYDGNIVRYNGTTGEVVKKYPSTGNAANIALSDGKLYSYITGTDAINVMNVDSAEVERTIPFSAANTKSVRLFGGRDGALYATTADGVNRMVKGGTVWENVIPANLSSLSIPSLYLWSGFPDEKDGIYMSFLGNDSQMKIVYSHYDETVPTVPNAELTVYSLYENDTVKQAIGEFQKQNPTAMVNYQIGIEDKMDTSVTVSDVIRALNTEILSNKAPDVLVLDGLPSESYIEKGVFADLTQFYEKMNKGDKLIEPVASTFKQDGKIYAIPARFKIPTIMGSEQTIAKINSLDDMKTNLGGDRPLIATGTAQEFVNNFITTSYSAWIKADGSLDTAKLTEFFKTTKEIYQTYKPKDENGALMMTMASGGGDGLYMTGADNEYIQKNVQTTVNITAAPAFHEIMINKNLAASYDKNYSNRGGLKLAPGQTDGAYVPAVCMGISAATKQKELAESFMQTMFSQTIQEYKFGDGFAVNEKAFNKSMMISLRDGEKRGEQEDVQMKNLVKQLKTPLLVDSVVMETISKQMLSILNDGKDIKKAVDEIQTTLKIYMAE